MRNWARACWKKQPTNPLPDNGLSGASQIAHAKTVALDAGRKNVGPCGLPAETPKPELG